MKVDIPNKKKLKGHFQTLVSLFLIFSVFNGFAEGTKEVSPTSSKIASLYFAPNNGYGSGLGAPKKSRIYFHISNNNTENLYFGGNFRTPGSNNTLTDVYYRIKNASDSVVAGPSLLPSTITSYIQAIGGPNSYSPITFNPGEDGDYYIEIYRGNANGASQGSTSSFLAPWFDFSVGSTTTNLIPGRVYCENWSFRATKPSDNFAGTFTDPVSLNLFTYTSDQTVVKVAFNNFKPLSFIPAFNSYGVNQSETNWLIGRKSINVGVIVPNLGNSFKTFLNNPDGTAYPVASFASAPTISGNVTGCPGSYFIPYNSNVQGDVKFVLDLNGVPDYQTGTSDRILEAVNVSVGPNLMPWDGKDGLGNALSANTTVVSKISMLRGRINLPLYDAEFNENGFLISSVAPTAVDSIRIFWDDSQLTNHSASSGNNSNITGSGIDNSLKGQKSPGHAWNGVYGSSLLLPPVQPNNDGTATPDSAKDDFGNVRVINTWFWGLEEKSATLNFRIPYCVSLEGRVFNDLNGLNNSLIDGVGINRSEIYAYLLNSSGRVVAMDTVNLDGSFYFNSVDSSNYVVRISTNAGVVGSIAPVVAIPNGFGIIGEGLTPQGDGNPNGETTISVASSNIAGINFGLNQFPNSNNANSTVPNPTGTNRFTAPLLAGIDAEDGILGANNRIRIKNLPINGTLFYNGTAILDEQLISNYNPSLLTIDPNFTSAGTLVFEYSFLDNTGFEDPTAAVVTINVANNPPTAINDTNNAIVSTAGASPLDALIASDIDGSIVSFKIKTLPSYGILAVANVPVTLNQVLTPTQSGALTYDPDGTFVGTDNFTFTATDNNGTEDSTPATVGIPVSNNPPVAINNNNGAMSSTAGPTSLAALGASDSDGSVVSFKIKTLPTRGTLAIASVPVSLNQILTPTQASSLTYDPDGSFVGTDSFTFTALDNNGGEDATPATIGISVSNNPPMAVSLVNGEISSSAGASPLNALRATDTDGYIVSYKVKTLPNNGILALAGNAVSLNQILTPTQATALTYDPNHAYVGTDIFTFTATDNQGAEDLTPATVNIPVYGLFPTAMNDAQLKNTLGSNVSLLILRNDTLSTNVGASASSATVDVNIATSVVENSITITGEGVYNYNNTTGQLVFVPESGLSGNPTPLNYVLIENSTGLKDTAQVIITYSGFPNASEDEDLNNLPHIMGVVNALINDTLSTGAIATVSSANVDLNPNTPSIDHVLTIPGQGEYIYNTGSGIVTFTPAVNFEGNPSPVRYNLIENANGYKSQALIMMTYLLPIKAADDSSMANFAGSIGRYNIIANDTLSNGSLATADEVEIDLDLSTAGIQVSKTVSGEGIWTYNAVNGELSFEPEFGFIQNPNPIDYILTELVTGMMDTARVFMYFNQIPPLAVNDLSINNTTGVSVNVNILSNDDLANGSPALVSNTTVDLNPATITTENSRVISGEGTYTYDNSSGIVTFVSSGSLISDPTPISYVLVQNNTGLKDTASIIIRYAIPVEAVNDESMNNIPGRNAIVNIIANDTLADGSTATPGEVTVDLNPLTPEVETIRDIPGEGRWSYNPSNGQLEFNPDNGFTGNPTLFSYKITENATGQSRNASITVEYVPANPPLAVNDLSVNNTPGVNAQINIVMNDTLTDGGAATSTEVTVDLDSSSIGIQNSLIVANQGVWTYNTSNGVVTFNPNPGFTLDPSNIVYKITELATGLADTAIISVTYRRISPFANSDISTNNPPQINTVINLIANDLLSDQTEATSNLVEVDLEPTVLGIQTSLLVVGEGIYNYNATNGNLTFRPAIGYYSNPSPLIYSLVEKLTGLSDTAVIRIQYNFRPSLELIKVGTLMGNRTLGDSIRFDFTIINNGNVPVTGISILDAKISSTPISVFPSALAPGGSAATSKMYYLTLPDILAGEVINSATVRGTSSNNVSVVDTSDNGDPGMPGGSNPTTLSLSGGPDVDVKLTSTLIGNCQRGIGDIVTYRINVFREDLELEMVDIVVRDSIGANFELVSQLPSEGSYNALTSRWSGISLAAGDTATLILQLRVLTNLGGLSCLTSWVDSLSHNDLDSNPGDRITTEDDISGACISVPITICSSRGDSAQLKAATGYSNYQWYLNGALIVGANSATYTTTTAGTYTVLVDGGICPNNLCCPIIVQENCVCPPMICQPIRITKTR